MYARVGIEEREYIAEEREHIIKERARGIEVS